MTTSEISAVAVKAVILKKEKILLLQRNPVTRNGEDSWDLPGGLVEAGEDLQAAVIRECKEELGVNIILGQKSKGWHFIRRKDNRLITVHNFFADIDQAAEIVLSDEHCGYGWFTIEEIALLKVKDPSFILSLQQI